MGPIEKGLAVLYRSNPLEVARVCDVIIDPRGALLGRVRALAECDGSSSCQARLHVHGCFADTGYCTEPWEHSRGQVPADTIEKAQRNLELVRAAFDSGDPDVADAVGIALCDLTEFFNDAAKEALLATEWDHEKWEALREENAARALYELVEAVRNAPVCRAVPEVQAALAAVDAQEPKT